MANVITLERRNQILSYFDKVKSIKRVTKELGVSRNTVRRVVRDTHPVRLIPAAITPPKQKWQPDYVFLEKLFELGRDRGENTDFKNAIMKTINSIQEELNAEFSALDTIRLETAFCEYINYRRFYLKALTASQGAYDGEYAKAHDKLARAVHRWVAAGQKSLENFNTMIQQVEFRSRMSVFKSTSVSIRDYAASSSAI